MFPLLNCTGRMAATVAGFATLVLFAPVAQANPGVPGAASGTCLPAFQTVALGAAPAPVTCTFHFVDAQGQPLVGAALNVAANGGLRLVDATSTRTDGLGLVRFPAAAPPCAAVGPQLGTVVATATSPATAASPADVATAEIGVRAQAVALVTCVEGSPGVQPAACLGTDHPVAPLLLPNGAEFHCTFHTRPQRGLDVSFALAEASTARAAFIVDESAQPDSAGNFQATVWNYGSPVTVIATMTSTDLRSGATRTIRARTTPDGRP